MRRQAAPAPRPPRRHQLVVPVQLPHRTRDRVPPRPQHPAARRARQLPARQLPLDHTPVTVYREHDASKRQPAAFPGYFAKRSHGEGRIRLRRDHRAAAHEKGQPERAALTTSATSATRTCAYILILNDRGQFVSYKQGTRQQPVSQLIFECTNPLGITRRQPLSEHGAGAVAATSAPEPSGSILALLSYQGLR